MPAVISSSFDIVITESLQNSGKTIVNPGRTFRIDQVLATGAAGAGIVVRKNTGAGTIAAGATQVNAAVVSSSPIAVSGTLANVLFEDTDNIFVQETQNALVTRVIIRCIAYDAQILTVT
jgi:hypothetical protein